MTNDGGPAFPVLEAITNTGSTRATPGMTLRDWFAGQALVGLLIDEGMGESGNHIDETCRDAYRYADEMLKVREKDQ
jgi:hypothetical protein